ncbi:MAG: tyrosine-type recombinase/integrase [Proteobacteria bacterium]|nr:tyrosine-type recombinase/integrase [Pseudomonadota bacterium]
MQPPDKLHCLSAATPFLAKTPLARPPGKDMAFIANSNGSRFTKEALGNTFRDACRVAGITGKSAHGLRKLLASISAEFGTSEEMLQAWFGWQSNRMSSIYTKSAQRKRMTKRMRTMMIENGFGTKNPRTSVSGAGNAPENTIKSKVKK